MYRKSIINKKKQKGQGLVEYSLILVLVAIVVISAMTLMGPIIGNVFSSINNSLTTAGSGGSSQPQGTFTDCGFYGSSYLTCNEFSHPACSPGPVCINN